MSNTISETNPSGGTELPAATTMTPPLKTVAQSAFLNEYDTSAVYGGHYPSMPFRPAQYQQNWTGIHRWQTYAELGGFLSGDGYPVMYRPLLVSGNAEMAYRVLEGRNRPVQYSAAPIAIQNYAINTQMVYNGSAFSGGY